MKVIPLLLVATLGNAIQLDRSVATEEVNPIGRVVALLRQFETKLNEEKEREEKLFEKYYCWCENVKKSKEATIKSAAARIQDIKDETEKIANTDDADNSIAGQLLKDLTDNIDNAVKTTDERQAAIDAWNKEDDHKNTAVTALRQAIEVLDSNKGADGRKAEDFKPHQVDQVEDFERPEIPNADVVFKLDYDAWTVEADNTAPKGDFIQLSSVLRKVHAHKDARELLAQIVMNKDIQKDMHFQPLAFALRQTPDITADHDTSGSRSGIIKLLSDMEADLDQQWQNGESDEKKAEKTYADFLEEIKKRIAASDKAYDENMEVLGQRQDALEKLMAEGKQLTQEKKDDEDFLEETTKDCAKHTDLHNERMELRAGELTAVGEAIKSLIKSQQKPDMFIQIAVKDQSKTLEALKKLKTVLDDRTSTIAKRQKDAEDTMNQHEADRKQNSADILKAASEADSADDRIIENAQDCNRLIELIKEEKSEIKEIISEFQAATVTRGEENTEFVRLTAEQAKTIAGVKEAYNVIKNYYQDKLGVSGLADLALVQGYGGGVAGGQAPPPPPKTAHEGDDYKGGAAGTSLLGMLQTLFQGVTKAKEEATEEEKNSLEAYNTLAQETAKSFKDLKTAIGNQRDTCASGYSDSDAQRKTIGEKNDAIKSETDANAAFADEADRMILNKESRDNKANKEVEALRAGIGLVNDLINEVEASQKKLQG